MIENENNRIIQITWRDQSPADALVQVGEWLENQGDLAAAGHYYEAAVAVDSTFAFAVWRLGQLALRQRKFADAIAALTEAAALTPDHAPTLHLLSEAHFQMGEVEKALQWSNAVLTLQNNHAGALLIKMRCLAQVRDWVALGEAAEDAALVLANAAERQLFAALSKANLGDWEAALAIVSRISAGSLRRHADLERSVVDAVRLAR